MITISTAVRAIYYFTSCNLYIVLFYQTKDELDLNVKIFYQL
jgi:hypothetical protein